MFFSAPPFKGDGYGEEVGGRATPFFILCILCFYVAPPGPIALRRVLLFLFRTIVLTPTLLAHRLPR